MCEKLVKMGADVNKLNADKCTCAHGAAFYKNIRVLEMLIENKCDINAQDISGKNILHLLCKVSFEEDFMVPGASTFSLCETDDPIPKQPPEASIDPTIALNLENYRNRIRFVKRLINELKMDPNVTDESDFNCLMYACEQDNVDMVQALIDCGADVISICLWD